MNNNIPKPNDEWLKHCLTIVENVLRPEEQWQRANVPYWSKETAYPTIDSSCSCGEVTTWLTSGMLPDYVLCRKCGTKLSPMPIVKKVKFNCPCCRNEYERKISDKIGFKCDRCDKKFEVKYDGTVVDIIPIEGFGIRLMNAGNVVGRDDIQEKFIKYYDE